MNPNQSPTREPQFTTPFSWTEFQKDPKQEVRDGTGQIVTKIKHRNKRGIDYAIEGVVRGKVERWTEEGNYYILEDTNLDLFLATPASPQLPEGEAHNPNGLTPEQVGEDYRLCVLSELDGRHAGIADFWMDHSKKWHIGNPRDVSDSEAKVGPHGVNSAITFRVPTSTPYPSAIDSLTQAVEPLEKSQETFSDAEIQQSKVDATRWQNLLTSCPDTSTTLGKISVMQAFLDGRKVEASQKGTQDWTIRVTDPNWDWLNVDYRIAPSPDVQPTHEQLVEEAIERRIALGPQPMFPGEAHTKLVEEALAAEPAPAFHLGGYYLTREGKMVTIISMLEKSFIKCDDQKDTPYYRYSDGGMAGGKHPDDLLQPCIYLDSHPEIPWHLPGIAPADINRVLYEEYFSKDHRPLKLGEMTPGSEFFSYGKWEREATVYAIGEGGSLPRRKPINHPITMPEAKPVEAAVEMVPWADTRDFPKVPTIWLRSFHDGGPDYRETLVIGFAHPVAYIETTCGCEPAVQSNHCQNWRMKHMEWSEDRITWQRCEKPARKEQP